MSKETNSKFYIALMSMDNHDDLLLTIKDMKSGYTLTELNDAVEKIVNSNCLKKGDNETIVGVRYAYIVENSPVVTALQ